MTEIERKNVISQLNLKPQVVEKLDKYVNLLIQEQQKMNLVSNSTLPVVWTRHVLDSAQLFSLIKESDKKIVDMGSGAGFPALVLACMDIEKKYHFSLIESDTKKANFLNAVIQECDLNATVLNDRIEKLKPFTADVVTARALAGLDKLLKYVMPFIGNKTKCLFMKGAKTEEELKLAVKKYDFSCEKINSITSDEGKILLLSKVKKR